MPMLYIFLGVHSCLIKCCFWLLKYISVHLPISKPVAQPEKKSAQKNSIVGRYYGFHCFGYTAKYIAK